jgi:uncharacterized protein YjgD (DUF1641 family)
MKTEQTIQEQMDVLNAKLDRVLEFVEQQHLRREELDDLMEDVSIVAKDAFQHTVQTLDKAGIELDTCSLDCMLLKIAGNLGTFMQMIEMLESLNDFMKDVTPILHQAGLDAIEKFHEFERKGYIDFVMQLGAVAGKFMQSFTAADLKRVEENIDLITGMLKDLTDTELLAAFSRSARVLREVKMDDQADDLSLWKIAMKMRSPEVRKSLSYSLRLLEAINKNN